MIPDIWIYIIDFLDLEGLAKYRLLDRSFRSLVETEVKNNRPLFNRVEWFLAKFIPNFELLKKVIIETGSVISGSCLLSPLLSGVNFNDIDIFVPEGSEWDVASLFGEDNVTMNFKNAYIHNSIPVGSQNFKINLPDIQLDIIPCLNTPSEIISSFDFTIVKNYYDGKSLIIRYPNHIIEKQLVLNRRYQYSTKERSEYRRDKYIRKGFNPPLLSPQYNEWRYSSTKKVPQWVYFERSLFENTVLLEDGQWIRSYPQDDDPYIKHEEIVKDDIQSK
jgi:hypothetical protein